MIYTLLFARTVQNMHRSYLCTGYMWRTVLPACREGIPIRIQQMTVFECLN